MPVLARVVARVVLADSPLSAPARLTAVAIAKHLNLDDDGRLSAWPGLDTLAALSGLSRSTVKRAETELVEAGVFQRDYPPRGGVLTTTRDGQTYQHPTARLTFVESPARFLAARGPARKQNVVAFRERERAAHGDRVQLQAQSVEFGGPRSEADVAADLAALARRTRGRLPKGAPRPKGRCFTDAQLVEHARLNGYFSWVADADLTADEQARQSSRAYQRSWFGFLAHVTGEVPCAACLASWAHFVRTSCPCPSLHQFDAWVCDCGTPVYAQTPDHPAECVLPERVGALALEPARTKYAGVHKVHGLRRDNGGDGSPCQVSLRRVNAWRTRQGGPLNP